MENEETSTAKELVTVDGVYSEQVSSSVIPELEPEEADKREPELTIKEEGGK